MLPLGVLRSKVLNFKFSTFNKEKKWKYNYDLPGCSVRVNHSLRVEACWLVILGNCPVQDDFASMNPYCCCREWCSGVSRSSCVSELVSIFK